MVDLIKKDPFSSLFSFPRILDDWSDFSSQKGLRVKDTDKDIIVSAVVAGVPAKDVDIDIEDGVLTIKAQKKAETKNKDEYVSTSYQYYYTCALSGGHWDKANAEVEDGIVTITIPKTESSRPRKISVKTKGK